ncbi:MAG: ABC transporter permease, partial [Thermoguttaceae bacterium]
MSLWKIAWRSIQQRALASALTAVSMALGVSLVVAVLVVQNVVYQSFNRRGEGYDLIVGAKGSRLELVLNSVYYVGQPIPNIPYKYYQEIAEARFGRVRNVIPLCLGDNYEGYRVVGTTPEMFDDLKYHEDQPYRFAEGGRNFKSASYFEAVVGAEAARRTGLKLGDTFRPTHDVAGEKGHKHKPFTVVGILEHTGTPNDRALFVNIEGFYRTAGHVELAGHDDDEDDEHAHEGPIPDDLKHVTAVLVGTEEEPPGMTLAVAKQINEKPDLQAAMPSVEIANLFENIIGNVELILLLFAVMIVFVAGIGIMVSIYNSMSDRRHEIAIMRALGASRTTVMLVILFESILLSLGGGVLGLAIGHGIVGLGSPIIASATGVTVGVLQFRLLEAILIPGLIALASIVGYLPAVAAYQTDVARS